MQDQLKEFEALGIRPVAISVDPPEVSANLRRKAGFSFTFLSDPNLDVIRRYDLQHVAAGPDGHDISRPAEFLVDRSRIVRWENFTEDVRVRPRAEEMLAAARNIQ